MRALTASILAVLAAGVAAGPEIAEDPPLATAPAAGDVTGQIAPAGKVAAIDAVCRATGKVYKPDAFDKAAGTFAFRNLPGDAAYDIRVTTADGARVEGIDLSWHEQRMLRLAEVRRKQLGLPAEAEHTFTEEDTAELLKYVKDLKDFADVRRALVVRGDGGRAVLLVEAMRARDFYAQRGDELIWRTELWYFRYRYGGWERMPNVERVLERHRIAADKWKAITLVYYPELSVRIDEKGKSEPVKFTLPDKLDPARGRLAGTEPKQDTKPMVMGEAKTEE